MTVDQIFHHKKHMVSSLELSMVNWSRYIALKLPWIIWENDVKEELPFDTFFQIFY